MLFSWLDFLVVCIVIIFSVIIGYIVFFFSFFKKWSLIFFILLILVFLIVLIKLSKYDCNYIFYFLEWLNIFLVLKNIIRINIVLNY